MKGDNKIFGFIKQARRALAPDRAAVVVASGKVESDQYGNIIEWFFNPGLGIPRDANLGNIRKFAKCPWVKMCTTTIIKEISGLGWEITPKKGFEDTFDEARALEVKAFFKKPNKDENFSLFNKKYLKDVLELDAGVIVKTFSPSSFSDVIQRNFDWQLYDIDGEKKETVEKEFSLLPFKEVGEKLEKAIKEGKEKSQIKLISMAAMPGESFLVSTDIHGRLLEKQPTFWQYSFYRPKAQPQPFFKRQIAYAKMDPSTGSFYGWSPIQSIMNILGVLTNATRFNKEFFEEFARADGILSMIGMTPEDIAAFAEMWAERFKGKPHKMGFVPNEVKWNQMTISNRDMEWLAGQKFYMRIVFAAFGVPASELGFLDESHGKNPDEVQERITWRKALKPHCELLKEVYDCDIITEFYLDKPAVETEFTWVFNDPIKEKEDEERWTQWLADGRKTINEWRVLRGEDPVPWGDEPYKPMPSGFSFNMGDEKKEKFLKGFPESEASDYADFLEKYYALLEREVLKSLEENRISGMVIKAVGVSKSFASFWRSLVHIFDVGNLKKKLLAVVKGEFSAGINKAEEEVDVDIGFSEKYMPLVERLTEEQITGFVMPSGQKWFGIQGVNDRLKGLIHQSVRDGLVAGEDVRQIAGRVKAIFEDAKTWQAVRIARTESDRISNQGLLRGYLESGIRGKKEWVAHIDDRTSDICKRLNGQRVEVHEVFSDSLTGGQFMHPPSHVNCRSRIVFVPHQRNAKDKDKWIKE